MTDQTAPGPQLPVTTLTHRKLKQWVALVSIWLLISAMLGVHLIRQRERIDSFERDRLGTQARVIEENLTRQIRGANAALAGVRYDLTTGDRKPDQHLDPLRLKVLSDAMPGVRSMLIMDNQGTIVDADRKNVVGLNFSEGQTFLVPAAERDTTKLYVSPPFKSRISGITISLGKVMLDSSGAFSGIVLASLDPEYFDQLMGSVLYAPDMAAGIVHGDGNVIVVLPANPALLAVNVNTGDSIFKRHKESGETVGVYEGTGATARPLEDRLTAVRTMQPADLWMNKPLIISVSRLRSAVYAPWYAEFTTAVVLATLALASSLLLLFYSQRRRDVLMAMRASVRRLQEESAKRLELGLEGADLGLWDWDIEIEQLTINSREAIMLGFTPGISVHSSKEWRRLIHPDDWPVVRTKFRELMDGRCDSFKIEHRMLHQQGEPFWVLNQATVIHRLPDGRASRILGTHLDITKRRAAEVELRNAHKRLELAMRCGSVGLMDWDVASGELVLNKLARDILGITQSEDLTVNAWRARRHPDDVSTSDAAMQKLVARESFDTLVEYRLQHTLGHYVWLHIQAEVVERSADDYPARVMITYRDVSARVAAERELQAANEKLARLSLTDALTGISNRRRFDEVLKSEWARNTRSQQSMALLMIDIDHFKLYNDHYGHQEGDDCLRLVAGVLSQCARRPDELLVRYGGEEFAVILFASEIHSALALAQRCVAEVSAAAIPHAASPVAPYITLSIGLHSVIPQPADACETLVKAADEALYQAKRSGRARAMPWAQHKESAQHESGADTLRTAG